MDEFAAAPDVPPITDAQAAEVERLYETNYGLPRAEMNATSANVTGASVTGAAVSS